MGHAVFTVLHVIAVLVAGLQLLYLTIPLHLIYAVLSGRSRASGDPEAPSPRTHVRCPICRELVRRDASKCRYCGAELAPRRVE